MNDERGEAAGAANTGRDLVAFIAVLVTAILLILVGGATPEAFSSYMVAGQAAYLVWQRIQRE